MELFTIAAIYFISQNVTHFEKQTARKSRIVFTGCRFQNNLQIWHKGNMFWFRIVQYWCRLPFIHPCHVWKTNLHLMTNTPTSVFTYCSRKLLILQTWERYSCGCFKIIHWTVAANYANCSIPPEIFQYIDSFTIYKDYTKCKDQSWFTKWKMCT